MRCKVYCSLKQPYGDGFYLSFSPVVDGSPENKEFFKYTPGGQVIFHVLNRNASEKFEQGKQYYVDFSPAE
jgi:hypothetical protein